MKRIRILLLLILCMALLAGCGTANEKLVAMVSAMDTTMTITIYGSQEQLSACTELIGALERKLSVTDDRSEIAALNRSGSAEVSEDTLELINTALSQCEKTGGALDITIYPVLTAWGFTTGAYRVPQDSEIKEKLTLVGYRLVHVDGNTVSLPKEGMRIDLGSVAKGYTGDRIIALLRESGVTSAMLNLGGNVQLLGTKPDGTLWRIAVTSPDGGDYYGYIDLADKAAITSGDYQRCFTVDDVTYHHIIDPATGSPARSGLRSVTVIGDSGAVCDALSTALFVMGPEDAEAFWRQDGTFEAVFILDDGSVRITEGLKDLYTPLNGIEADIIFYD